MPRARAAGLGSRSGVRACAREQGKGEPPMADEAQTIRSINWRDVFPFTNLFKAFRVAVHPSKLVLALTALLLIYAGGRVLDGLWLDKHLVLPGQGPAGSTAGVSPALERFRDGITGGDQATALDIAAALANGQEPGGLPRSIVPHPDQPRGIFITFFDYEVSQVNSV